MRILGLPAALLLVTGCASHPAPPVPPPYSGPQVVLGEAVAGRLANGSAYDEWSWVHPGGQVTLLAESSEFTPTLDFGRATAAGFERLGWFFSYYEGHAQGYRHPGADRYVVRVGPDSLGRGGAYTLRVIPGVLAQPLHPGQTVTGSLQGDEPQTSDGPLYYSYYHDDWALTATGADSLVVRMHARAYMPRVAIGVLEGTDFHRLADGRGPHGGTARAAIATVPGRRYVVRVGGTDQQTGQGGIGGYALEVDGETAAPGRLAPLEWYTFSRMMNVMDHEAWTYTPARGGRVTLELDSTSAAPVLHFGTMEGGRFVPLAQADGHPHAATRLQAATEAGREYRIQVRGTGSGPYTLRIRPLDAAADIPPR